MLQSAGERVEPAAGHIAAGTHKPVDKDADHMDPGTSAEPDNPSAVVRNQGAALVLTVLDKVSVQLLLAAEWLDLPESLVRCGQPH